MTETRFEKDWMATETRITITKKPASSGKKLMPTSSTQILANHLKELEMIEQKLNKGSIITRTKLRRVLSRRHQLIDQLIPKMQIKLAS